MKEFSFSCTRLDCFANVNGGCKALVAETEKKPCPFFKTQEQVDAENCYAQARLKLITRVRRFN